MRLVSSRSKGMACFSLVSLMSLVLLGSHPVLAQAPSDYRNVVLESQPLLYLPFEENADQPIQVLGSLPEAKILPSGPVKLGTAGPRPNEYPAFTAENRALTMSGGKQKLVISGVTDPAALQFRNGDALTIEAWIRPDGRLSSPFPYIVGKGRTHNPGFNSNNQNYALRLASGQGVAPLSFFFVDEEVVNKGSTETNGHRWTSQAGVPLDGQWHHVALVYEFGKPDSIRGYIDGKPTAGKWDLGGPTTRQPIVDNDEVWIGSSMKGSNTFQGQIDELAIHRQALSAETIAARFQHNPVNYIQQLVDEAASETVPVVRVDVYEGISSTRDWNFRTTEKQTIYETDSFALTEMPRKYNARGIIDDRPAPFLVHLHSTITLPTGEHELIFRSLNSARLYVDGKMLLETPFMTLGSSAHGNMHVLQPPKHGELPLDVGHTEKRVTYVSDGQPHHFSMLAIVGYKNLPAWPGELTVAVGKPGETYQLLGPERRWDFTDEGWLAFQEKERVHRLAWNAAERQRVSQQETAYWQQRHEQTRQKLDQLSPAVELPEAVALSGEHPIDALIAAQLKQNPELQQTAVIEDWAYLRRVTLDLIGTNPTPEQIAAFWADSAETRRQQLVERLLQHPAWADHWVSYWQDVLAENPGLTKPMLNNSGPFRRYLHEAFSDGRPMDRIVTELLLMEGSKYEGGTAGFEVASNSDVPMAEKAHILGTAFLGVEMKCARCHDAPHHDVLQKDLFEVAGMLGRKPMSVPLTSSIPGTPEQLASMTVRVTLTPGSTVAPNWPFAEFVDGNSSEVQGLVRNAQNSREVLAALVTSPQNKRFAEVMVNRVWKRLIGRGIVEPAEDWEAGEPSHPELLSWLTREFIREGYDLKALTRIIMSSRLYQQEALAGQFEAERLFAGPTRRRLTAEQMFDTLYQAVGKPLPTERLTYNADNRLNRNDFIDFGRPRKAWELVAIGNERERPSMNLPMAQSVADFLSAYGWRSERQDPLTDRENIAMPLQPLAMANGTVSNRAFDISEHADIVELCLASGQPQELVEQLFQRVLCRQPDREEMELFVVLLQPGFHDRKTGVQEIPCRKVFRSPLTWTAHFDPAATDEGLRQQELAEQGDQPTLRLQSAWRERAEDALWVLFNTPEFVFVP